jgi:hypothetical protein
VGQPLMNERTIFTEALERETATERSAYLDEACAGDKAIRGRVEALLRSHDQAGTFLGKPVPERLGEGLAAEKAGDDTQTGPSAPAADEGLDFLEPSDKPGVLGRLGHYEVLELLGRGGMGVVLRAFDEQLHRVVAIKVMAAQLATNGTARRRFTREARAAAAVSHDHVVTIHAVEDAGPRPHIVMQYVAGASLQERLDRTGPLPLPEILRIGMQAAAGLAAAHAQGLVHRDVKPANILMENGVERVKITDFGLARAADDASLTQSGGVAGTPSFMSPEQAEGKPVDHRSDLFSLGSVLYAMCTGRPPFRSSTSMGVLKRVCEEIPTPIRETNPEVPDWLAAVVAKLRAKDPAARFQSAAQVAEVLGQHLAHVQHPSVVPLPAVAKLAEGPAAPARPERRKRWAVGVAVLVAMFAALGVSEATGVTNVRTTIIRVFTPDGTLVVETDDPDVKVTVEGDGGLVVTGAGLQEIRLKPGSYRVLADRDGKRVPLDRELVIVSRGGREIVRVKLESTPPSPVAKAEKDAFVLLAAGTERKFDTLAEAVLTSAAGDTIEVRGNGPFVLNPIAFKHALTIRAGSGFRPVFTGDSQQNPPWGNLMFAFAPLRLEGLEIRSTSKAHCILQADGELWVAGCALTTEGAVCIKANAAGEVRNCVLVSPAGCSLALLCGSQGTSVVTNNLLIGQVNLEERDHSKGATFRFTGNTIVSPLCNAFLHLTFDQPIRPTDPLENRVHLSLANNVIDCCSGPYGFLQGARPHLSAKDAELWLRRRLEWRDENNCYQVKLGQWIQFASDGKFDTSSHKTLADWNTFWGLKANGSSEDGLRFLGGNLIDRVSRTTEKLTPEHFRLRSDSAGYRAGKDGKDIGVNIDLIGPGAAYERWKTTPDYQQWLKDTGQKK